jgi:hypothetical protein
MTSYTQAPVQLLYASGHQFAYRQVGVDTGVPLILVGHLAATLDNWDPLLVDELARDRLVIAVDNIGIGSSSGTTPISVGKMATGIAAFIQALPQEQVDVLGLSLGGFALQELLLQQPQLVRKAIFAGTGPAGGVGISKVPLVTFKAIVQGILKGKDPKYYLFFPATAATAANQFLNRLQHFDQPDRAIAVKSFIAQLIAVWRWGRQQPQNLNTITHPALVVNGEYDSMVPSENTTDLANRLAQATMPPLYPGAGHGAIFQEPELFAQQVSDFLADD